MKHIIITDEEIDALIKERKLINGRFSKRENMGSNEHILNLTGVKGNKFCIIIRVSMSNNRNFSVVLGVKGVSLKKLFHLKRYNNDCHQHTNRIEDEELSACFHIHIATERYQIKNYKEDGYATPTQRYNNVSGALKCLFKDANIEDPNDRQYSLFEDL